MLEALNAAIASGADLPSCLVEEAVLWLTNEDIPASDKATFLAAFSRRGERPSEIAGFAAALRARAIPVPVSLAVRQRGMIDVCGTGGDRLSTFNISTTVSLLVASCGVTVAKHGNRAITSRSGSADVLEALGIRVDLDPAEAAEWLERHGFAFLMAPRHHPAFRHIAPARRLCAERGQRTLFNFLGPLLNPAFPDTQLLGVSRPDLCEPMARVLQTLGLRRAMVVCGDVPGDAGEAGRHLDEWSTLGLTRVAEFYQDRAMAQSVMEPFGFPLQPVQLADLAGGDSRENAMILRAILSGEDRGPRRDAVVLNAAAALFVAGEASSMVAGWERAAAALDSGKALETLDGLVRASSLRNPGSH